MVVQIASGHQFLRPRVETRDTGFTSTSLGILRGQTAVFSHAFELPAQPRLIGWPNGWVVLQPALEIGPPEHLMGKAFGFFKAMGPEGNV